MPFVSFGTDKQAQKKAVQDLSAAAQITRLRKVAAEIERKMQAARAAAHQIGKDVALIRDNLGRLRMVFVETIDKGERAIASQVHGKDMGSEVNHLGGFREQRPRLGAWPAQGFAFPTRGYIAPMPRGYAKLYRTHPIPR